jgi:hypothetical protein
MPVPNPLLCWEQFFMPGKEQNAESVLFARNALKNN